MTVLLALVLACSGKTTDDTADSKAPADDSASEGVGRLSLRFAIEPDYLPILESHGELPSGAFYGSFWRGDQVTGAGPDEGAEDLGGIELELVDLSPEGGPTAVLMTSEDLPATEIVVLGFLDTDNNGAETHDPDEGDPVTLPADNDFDVVAGANTEVTVFFGLLNP